MGSPLKAFFVIPSSLIPFVAVELFCSSDLTTQCYAQESKHPLKSKVNSTVVIELEDNKSPARSNLAGLLMVLPIHVIDASLMLLFHFAHLFIPPPPKFFFFLLVFPFRQTIFEVGTTLFLPIVDTIAICLLCG